MRILEGLFSRKRKPEKGSYGKSLIILSSDPAEIERLCEKLGDEYSVIMDVEELSNYDYSKVIIRKENLKEPAPKKMSGVITMAKNNPSVSD